MFGKRAVVTVGISEARLFGPYLERWERTFRQYGCADYLKIWQHEWPPGSLPHGQCHYAFKVHAVWDAYVRGYTSILWMDSSCHAIRPLSALWQRLERDGHVLIEDANRLGNWSSDRSLAQFGISRDDAMKMPLLCGTCWGVDLTNPRSLEFIRQLRQYATPDNFMGTHNSRLPGLTATPHPRPGTEGATVSDDERAWGHRSDEVYMGGLAHKLGMQTHVGVEFVGGSTVNEHACVRSGYDLPPLNGAVAVTPEDSKPRRARDLVTIGEHTIDAALLTEGGLVLDAGCRDFNFAKGMVARGCRVVALDADPFIIDPELMNVVFLRLALAAAPGERELILHDNPEARCLAPEGVHYQGKETAKVEAVTLLQLMDVIGVARWDVVKFDIEGSEYDVLLSWPKREKPIARQISIEFHDHCEIRPQSVYDAIFAHLGECGYEVVQHNQETRHCCPPNYWDTLVAIR